MNTMYAWIAGVVFAILGAFGFYFKGRKDSRTKEAEKVFKEKLKAEEHKSDVLQKAKQISEDVASTPNTDVQQQLRDKWSRD